MGTARNADPDVRLAVALYQATAKNREVDCAEALALTDDVAAIMNSDRPPELRWWFWHTRGIALVHLRRPFEGVEACRRAVHVARSVPGLENEWERSTSNLLHALRAAGDGDAVASEFADYVRGKPSSELRPRFYQMVSDALLWIGDAELAGIVRETGYRRASRDPQRDARDAREIARCQLALRRYGEASRWLARADVEGLTVSERRMTGLVRVELLALNGECEAAEALLAELAPNIADSVVESEWALLAVVEAYLDNGRFDDARRVLDTFIQGPVLPYTTTRVNDLRARLHEADGELEAAAHLLAAGIPAHEKRWVKPTTIIEIRSVLDPLLATLADIPSILGGDLLRRVRRSEQWAIASGRDMRRILSPALLALESVADRESTSRIVRSTVDELRVVHLLHRDVDRPVESDVLSEIFAALGRIWSRNGATFGIEAGDEPLKTAFPYQVGVALALVALESIEQRGGDVRVEIGEGSVDIEVSAVSATTARSIVDHLNDLRQRRDGIRFPSFKRGSVVSSLVLAVSSGWTVGARWPRDGELRIRAELERGHLSTPTPGTPNCVSLESVEQSRHRFVAAGSEAQQAVRRELADLYDRRAAGAKSDPTLIERAHEVGDRDTVLVAYLTGASLAVRAIDYPLAEQYLASFVDVAGDDARSFRINESWVGSYIMYNARSVIADGLLRAADSWEASCNQVILQSGRSMPPERTAVLNVALDETERWGLVDALQIAYIRNFTADSELATADQTLISIPVAVAVADFELAEQLVVSALDSAAWAGISDEMIDLLRFGVRVALARGDFETARRRLDDLDTQQGWTGGSVNYPNVLRAWYLQRTGRPVEAQQLLDERFWSADLKFQARAVSLATPLDARLKLAQGDVDGAVRRLDSLPIERSSSLDLLYRLHIETRVGEAAQDWARVARAHRMRVALVSGEPRFSVDPSLRDELREALEHVMAVRMASGDTATVATRRAVAHDLGNALSVIELDLELSAERGGGPGAPSEYALRSIIGLADQLDASFDTRLDQRHEPVRISNVLASVVDGAVAYSAQFDRLVTIELDDDVLDAALPRSLAWNLQIILTNLLSNAVRYCADPGVVKVTATRRVAQTTTAGVDIDITIEDNGPGLGPIERTAFETYSSGSGSSGLGLGLWIVTQYVPRIAAQLHLGRSSLGGASFQLSFRAASSESAPADTGGQIGGDASPVGSRQLASSESEARPDRHLLILEDDTTLAALLARVFRRRGWRVSTVSSTTAGVEVLDQQQVDAVLADVELDDELTGYDFYAAANERQFDGRFVLMSGHRSESVKNEMITRFGITVTVLAKPFGHAEAIEAIEAGEDGEAVE